MVGKGEPRLSNGLTDRNGDAAPITAAEIKQLFADFKNTPAIVLAVSGGPDSVALMVLAARWRKAFKRGPKLIAVTVDHGLRSAAASEALTVKRLAKKLGVEHHTLRWSGPKRKTGLPAAAREARYRLLAGLARNHGTLHVVTAHTRDDQAETVVMRLSRGSGLAGLAAMTRESKRDGWVLARPLLDVPKARLLATLAKAGISFVVDPTNHDTAFTRARLRTLMPTLAKEGCDARNLARLAARLGRANAALESVTDAAERMLLRFNPQSGLWEFETGGFFSAPDEVRLRLLTRLIDRVGHEGPAELAKAESLLSSLDHARQIKRPARWQQTLAGAAVGLSRKVVSVGPAPLRQRRDKARSGNKP
jgi:tRNA(Ile)-lysidine synthase